MTGQLSSKSRFSKIGGKHAAFLAFRFRIPKENQVDKGRCLMNRDGLPKKLVLRGSLSSLSFGVSYDGDQAFCTLCLT